MSNNFLRVGNDVINLDTVGYISYDPDATLPEITFFHTYRDNDGFMALTEYRGPSAVDVWDAVKRSVSRVVGGSQPAMWTFAISSDEVKPL